MNRAAAAAALCLCSTAIDAQDARQIVSEVHKRATASSQRYTGLLQVIDDQGKTSAKRWTYERLGSHGNSKTIIRFLAPPDVKGVALLILNHPDRASDQWMWTPAINRERRIALQDRRPRFFGTDFSFEDLEERDVEHHEYSLRGEEAIEGEPCWRIESTPRAGRRSQYSRSMLWVRKANFTYARIDNYTGETLTRRIRYSDLVNIEGIWTARSIEVHDFTRKSRTLLSLESVAYNIPLRDDQFTLEALRRG
jgi:hypothetical protein